MSSSDTETTEGGRKAVRARLIEPLLAEGMKRRQGETVEDERAFIDRLVGKLAYMAPESLDRLLPIVRALAGGAGKNRWPEEISVVNFAHGIEAPPDRSDEVLWSWLHSVAGERARREGVLMATRAFIKTFRFPPKDKPGSRFYADRRLPEMQREIDRDIEMLRRSIASGEARPSEVEHLRAFEETLAGLEAIVEAGIRHRREKTEAVADEGRAA